MRTTIDIPESLLRRAKSTAALRGIRLKDLIASFVEKGLEANVEPAPRFGHSMPLPDLIKRTGVPIPSLTGAEMEEILLREEMGGYVEDRSA